MSVLVYFSSSSENTHRFVKKLCIPAKRIPLIDKKEFQIKSPYILVIPSYNNGILDTAVPHQVTNFLNTLHNKFFLKGVIGSGNKNFGVNFCIAGNIISKKYKVPLLYKFELLGTNKDVINVKNGINKFWKKLNLEKKNQNA
ncbi:nrdI [Wigglesworthia glossinidia endosymbiont of Glossina brevipalpis]|uniref:Protein NrdI n=1 Tax=Wigglesworthia glossinidia brevipalpis TaxID=36870 RepID=NRDI_WIGBR|nr:RecName: Full=Protein NrdI [Wigglesworthia glossinidia endosymbiont of Glossina brevipalpis]BAC24757.1 nrdI [Wigglesworthia glossinidia endosymbiont of Glossina brevipalpis]